MQSADGVCTITLNRPHVLNAFIAEMLHEIRRAVRDAEDARDTRVMVITGAGRGFCAGQDLNARRWIVTETTRNRGGDSLRQNYHPLLRQIRGSGLASIAAVNGVAAGAGIGLALACDIRLMAREASFVQAFARIGLVPDAGNFWHLPRMVGRGRAIKTAMLGERVDADEAARSGLVTSVVPGEWLAEETARVAKRLARLPDGVVDLTRRGVYTAMTLGRAEAQEYGALLMGARLQ